MAPSRVTATTEALDLIERLRAVHGPLVFFLSAGCCEGSVPMCLRAGELTPGPGDVLLGEIARAPFYVAADQDERWNRPRLSVGVAPGPSDTFSLEGPCGVHFVATSALADAACVSENQRT
jgi:uncharacterized protein